MSHLKKAADDDYMDLRGGGQFGADRVDDLFGYGVHQRCATIASLPEHAQANTDASVCSWTSREIADLTEFKKQLLAIGAAALISHPLPPVDRHTVAA